MKRSSFVILATVPLVVIASIALWKVSGDDSRRQGALGSGEAVALSWRGDWTAETAYAPGSVVTHEGISYVAESEKPSTPEPECVECGWSQLASGGAPEGSASGAGALTG
jgi:hypothetical protein